MDLLSTGAEALGVALTTSQALAFERYLEEIQRWSTRMNLTALRTPVEIVRDGFLDSLACLALIPSQARLAIDIGSGAGFPALPLAIPRPGLEFTLVESTRKKVSFLRHAVRTLALPNVRVFHDRAEALGREPAHMGVYDLAMARAVAPLPDQARLVRPFLSAEGIFLAQISQGPPGEEGARALTEAGWTLAQTLPVPSAPRGGRLVLAFRRR
jgi:16S rRNA (guanine527-N7)-methyltransferase